MNKVYYTVKLGHTRVTFEALVDKVRTNISRLTGNASYATPMPALAVLTAAADRLDAAVQAYEFTRSRLDKQERDIAFAELKGLHKDLGGYVQTVSNGDPELITSAGFEMEAQGKPLGLLPAPVDVRATAPQPGQPGANSSSSARVTKAGSSDYPPGGSCSRTATPCPVPGATAVRSHCGAQRSS